MTKLLRRFNFTQRIQIPRSKVHMETEVGADDAAYAVVQKLDLSDYGQHERSVWNTAQVFVEARRTSTESFARLALGTVGGLESEKLPLKFQLDGFADEGPITYRVKVVDSESRLLADGDNIKTGEADEAERVPLIHLLPVELGEQAWMVSWEDSAGPVVFVNKKLPNCTGLLTRDPLCVALVLPQIVREVLRRALQDEQRGDGWIMRWLEFARHLGHDDPPEPEDDQEIGDWIEQVVATFSATSKLGRAAADFLGKVDEV